MKRPLAYITAPWSNSQYENAEHAAAYCRQVYDAGYSPICPVLFLPAFLKDEIPQEHKDGLDMARDYLRRSHVLVVCGHGIPFGKLTIIQGNPGEGKTYFAMRLAAACTNRKPLPGMETLEPFNIIYQTAEDGLGDTVKPRLMEADADLEKVLVIDDRDTPLTLADERIARAIRENNARLVIIDPVQAFLGADVDMNRANEVRPIFRSLGDIAQATGCAIVLIGHLNKAAGTQSTYRGLGSIDITAAVRSLLFIGKLKDSPTTRVLIHEKSSLAPPGQSLAFSLGDEKGFEWIGAYDITADELLAGTDTAKTESKTAQAQMLILELLADGKRMPSAELEKTVNERGISSRTMRTAKSRIGDRLVTEKDGTAWVCYLRD